MNHQFKEVYFVSSYWSVGPIRPSDQSDAIVAGFLYMFLSICLSIYISMSRRRVPTSFPQWPSRPSEVSCLKRQTTNQAINRMD